MTVIIHLTRGYEALIDDCDADLAETKWYPMEHKTQTYALHITPDKKSVLMHRVILSRMLNRELERFELVDHEKGNGLLNVRSNLRLASNTQNARNKKQISQNPYKGIALYKHINKWGAFIVVGDKKNYLGVYADPLEAHQQYCIAALKHHAPFHNFGDSSPFTGMTLADFDKPIIQLVLPLKDAA